MELEKGYLVKYKYNNSKIFKDGRGLSKKTNGNINSNY